MKKKSGWRRRRIENDQAVFVFVFLFFGLARAQRIAKTSPRVKTA